MRLPPYRWRVAHLAALWGYGVSQPVFSMLKGNPELLYLKGTTRTDAIAFALAVAFVPPLVVVAIEALSGLASKALSDVLHVLAVGGFGYLAVLQLTRLLGVERGAALLLPVVPAVLVAVLYVKLNPVRSFLALSLLLPVVGMVGFVTSVPSAVDDVATTNVRVAKPVPVVLVVFDEFPVSSLMRPDGSIDAVRYPNFARLAREGTWYPHATTVHEFTTGAVPAILTGQLPRRGEHPTLADHPENLFTLVGGRYAIQAIEPETRLCPTRYCPTAHTVSPAGTRLRLLFKDAGRNYLRRVLPRDVRGWRPFLSYPFESDVQRFLRGTSSSGRRETLDFLHVSLPHATWRTLPSGHEYQDPLGIDGIEDDRLYNQWTNSRWLVDQSLQAHLLQVGFTDRVLGRLTRRLEASSLYDNALMIVVADHGASFQPDGSRRVVRQDNFADIAGVPLFVKYPHQREGRIDERSAKTIDIVPTIADVLGVRIPWRVDGVSLRRAPVSRPVSVSRSQGDPLVEPLATVAAGVLATARRNAALFGVGRDSMYRIGPFVQLLDKSPDPFLSPDNARDDVRLDNAMSFAGVRTSSGFVPARIAGTIGGGAVADGTALAIAVSGHIRAMTRSYEFNGQTRFEALVPETSFHDGDNAVAIYAVSRTGDALRLSRLGGTPPRANVLLTAATAPVRRAAGPKRP